MFWALILAVLSVVYSLVQPFIMLLIEYRSGVFQPPSQQPMQPLLRMYATMVAKNWIIIPLLLLSVVVPISNFALLSGIPREQINPISMILGTIVSIVIVLSWMKQSRSWLRLPFIDPNAFRHKALWLGPVLLLLTSASVSASPRYIITVQTIDNNDRLASVIAEQIGRYLQSIERRDITVRLDSCIGGCLLPHAVFRDNRVLLVISGAVAGGCR